MIDKNDTNSIGNVQQEDANNGQLNNDGNINNHVLPFTPWKTPKHHILPDKTPSNPPLISPNLMAVRSIEAIEQKYKLNNVKGHKLFDYAPDTKTTSTQENMNKKRSIKNKKNLNHPIIANKTVPLCEENESYLTDNADTTTTIDINDDEEERKQNDTSQLEFNPGVYDYRCLYNLKPLSMNRQEEFLQIERAMHCRIFHENKHKESIDFRPDLQIFCCDEDYTEYLNDQKKRQNSIDFKTDYPVEPLTNSESSGDHDILQVNKDRSYFGRRERSEVNGLQGETPIIDHSILNRRLFEKAKDFTTPISKYIGLSLKSSSSRNRSNSLKNRHSYTREEKEEEKEVEEVDEEEEEGETEKEKDDDIEEQDICNVNANNGDDNILVSISGVSNLELQDYISKKFEKYSAEKKIKNSFINCNSKNTDDNELTFRKFSSKSINRLKINKKGDYGSHRIMNIHGDSYNKGNKQVYRLLSFLNDLKPKYLNELQVYFNESTPTSQPAMNKNDNYHSILPNSSTSESKFLNREFGSITNILSKIELQEQYKIYIRETEILNKLRKNKFISKSVLFERDNDDNGENSGIRDIKNVADLDKIVANIRDQCQSIWYTDSIIF
ncbi:anaphase promoting complex subunit 9 SCDLUD_001726 [Saccharomycodes ludwigii]|uniref:anaphase promoting complex subunit 9 n=1 Tax=Saccharomycodes ludwigii TaxID=36035 RepID=UPI001E8A7E94|nr:hypothetical protein SCDLUD_001726 [Saccharomycodes ludwigii]KAH3901941.1 hypothetical protein SCDLUD_001726 [Saccharomycodes ludwigii]